MSAEGFNSVDALERVKALERETEKLHAELERLLRVLSTSHTLDSVRWQAKEIRERLIK